MKSILIGSCTALVLAVAVACGGSSGGGAPQTQPSGVPSGGTNATTISILGDRGGASFTPNPAPSGASDLAFKNNDSQIHRIVANDGSFDSGDIAPGATKTVSLASDGTNYHCLIHPDMIGAVSASDGAPPRCTGIYC